MHRWLVIAFGLGSSPLLLAQATLVVEITLNEPAAGGVVHVALCPDRGAYDTERGCELLAVPATGGSVRAEFIDLLEGTYAVKAFHDINGNKKLDTNMIGWPTEPFGFSNDAPVVLGPPGFGKASFPVVKGSNLIRLKLR